MRGSPADVLKRMKRTRASIEQLIRDTEWWNEHRTDAPPFDVGIYRVDLAMVNTIIEAAERGDISARDKGIAAYLQRGKETRGL